LAHALATLTSNGVSIPFSPQYFADLRAVDFATLDKAEARARYAADGYVVVRGALSAEIVAQVRKAYLDLFASRSGEMPTHGTHGHPAHDFVRGETFRGFTSLPVFKELAEAVLDAPAELIRRTPLRHFMPGRKVASRAHLDKTYIAGVPVDVATIWVPLGDCPIEAGTLLYLDGSHRDPSLEARLRDDAPMDRVGDARPLTHDLKWLSDATGKRWLWTDFAAGDVVLHSPDIIHASTDPQSNITRISTDIRFRRAGSARDPRWDDDWSADDGY
jgi:ectoine hydroxylase-related dioxygenase (phytanoyl-CoA dioxygenase family)